VQCIVLLSILDLNCNINILLQMKKVSIFAMLGFDKVDLSGELSNDVPG
jgi:hypothetical protein